MTTNTLPLPVPEHIEATRQWFADNALACIAEVESGEVKVNDPGAYFEWRRQERADALAGKFDHTFAFRQRAHQRLTGVCVPFFAEARRA